MQGVFLSFVIRSVIILIIAILVDIYFYQAVLNLIKHYSHRKKLMVKVIYWSFTVFTAIFVIVGLIWSWQLWPKAIRIYTSAVVFIAFFSKLFGVILLLIDDVIRAGEWLTHYFSNKKTPINLGRHKFLTNLALLIASIPFTTMLYGIIKTAFDYTVRRETVKLPNLPAKFDGIKIVQISDIHTGSFVSIEPLEKAVRIILDLQPDIVFFTGDLVNNVAEEVEEYIDTLSKIKAPMGVYSILGNHDYGDYIVWNNIEDKRQNLIKLKNAHKRVGWNLLLNENVKLKREDEEIALIGVENWGKGARWPKYGDLKKAMLGIEDLPVKLLLSHDPSHWDAKVRTEAPDIDITFSGHTHGFQFGIEIPGIKWSPAKYLYRQWAGLYTEGIQHIYVNRGLGFLGYPGRVGIKPEITVLQLRKG